MDIFIDIALSIDRTIYTWIPYVYNLIVKIAEYEVFSPEQINGLSRRIYALLGIFMLFKLSFSMISYIVNPDEFADKTKGFGGLIKNVIISMVLIVAVPYIFVEAYNVQKMILEDGTIIKLVLPVSGANDDTNSDRSSIAYASRGAGEEISFILFTQFSRPNDVIVSIKDNCRRIYALDESENRIHATNSEYAYALDSKCDKTLYDLFTASTENKTGAYQYYKDAMEYENYNILVNHPEIFKAEVPAEMYANASDGKSIKSNVKVIKYNWILSFIIGIVILLFLTTICIDVATRTIKLAFYQIIAPIPIISHCDPKAKKDGMFNKWVKACFATYLDLFIRLFVFFLAIFIIRAFTQKMYSNNSDTAIILFIIIGALVFAKQAPKIIEDLTGLKIEKFTLNPFKKVANEALLPEKVGKAIGKIGFGTLTGAAGGALAGFIGGGNSFGQKMLSSAMGTVKGGLKSEGFTAGVRTQANINRKMRDARIAGASFFGSVGAAALSVFGADNFDLEREQLIINNMRRRSQAENDAHDLVKKRNDSRVTSLDTQTANLQRRKKAVKAVFDGGSAIKSNLSSDIKANKAGYTSRKLEQIKSDAKTLSEMSEHGTVFSNDKYVWVAKAKDGNLKMEKILIRAGQSITPDMVKDADNATSLFENKDGLAQYGDVSFNMRNGLKPKTYTDTDTGLVEYVLKDDGTIDYEDMTTTERDKFNKDRAEFVNLVDQQEIRLEQHNQDYGTASSYTTTSSVTDGTDVIEVNEAAKVDYKAKIDGYAAFKEELDAQEALVTSFDTSMIRVNNRKDTINDETKQDLQNRNIDGRSLTDYNNEIEEREKTVKRVSERRKPNYEAANAPRGN